MAYPEGTYVPKLRICQNCGRQMIMVGKRTQTCPHCWGKICPVNFVKKGH